MESSEKEVYAKWGYREAIIFPPFQIEIEVEKFIKKFPPKKGAREN